MNIFGLDKLEFSDRKYIVANPNQTFHLFIFHLISLPPLWMQTLEQCRSSAVTDTHEPPETYNCLLSFITPLKEIKQICPVSTATAVLEDTL